MLQGIEIIERDLWEGDLDRLADARCPLCGERSLSYSAYVGAVSNRPEDRRRRQRSMNVRCLGSCGAWLSHIDGLLPDWAAQVEDWEDFSLRIREGRAALEGWHFVPRLVDR